MVDERSQVARSQRVPNSFIDYSFAVGVNLACAWICAKINYVTRCRIICLETSEAGR